ncbi:MAG: plastocyanin/azurin family copper-binding protein [Candidatus Heimdallarchaeota archaeon]
MIRRASILILLMLAGSFFLFFQFPAPTTVLADEMVTITAGTNNQLSFDKSEIRVPADTWVNLTLTVVSSMSHNFVIENFATEGFQGTARTATINNGDGSDSIRFKTPANGVTVMFYCSVGSHRALGMEGDLVVVGNTNPPPPSSSPSSTPPDPGPSSSTPPISSEPIGGMNGNATSSVPGANDSSDTGETSSVIGFQLITVLVAFIGLASVTFRFKKKKL